MNSELFRPRYSELSDEIRTKNKREDRLLEVRLKYYDRERNIRLNILRKEQYQLECTRSALIEQLVKIQQDKPKQIIPQKPAASEWHEFIPTIQAKKPITPIKVIRPHSAG